MRNRNSNLRIPSSDALPLSDRDSMVSKTNHEVPKLVRKEPAYSHWFLSSVIGKKKNRETFLINSYLIRVI